MFGIRDLMFNAARNPAAGLGIGVQGPVVCWWPSNDCCGQFWSNPGGGFGMSHWLTTDPTIVGCGGWISDPGGCGLARSTLPPGTFQTVVQQLGQVRDPSTLAVLRAQLDEAVEFAEQRRAEMDEAFVPTAKQVEALEAQAELLAEHAAEQRRRLDERG